MKITSIKNYFNTLFMFLLLANTFGQNMEENLNLLLIREDKVSPAMADEYEMSLADLKNYLVENQVQGFNYFTHIQDNFEFVHIVPLNNLDELSEGTREALIKKVNKPELSLILDYFDLSLDSYRHYVVQYKPELSYVPSSMQWDEGNTYRKWHYYHFYPGSEEEVEEILAAYKHLYKTKNVKMGFRVFAGQIGLERPAYILTTWAKSPLDYHENLEKVSEMLGDNGALLWTKLMELVKEAKITEGWYLPQYSYAPEMKMAE